MEMGSLQFIVEKKKADDVIRATTGGPVVMGLIILFCCPLMAVILSGFVGGAMAWFADGDDHETEFRITFIIMIVVVLAFYRFLFYCWRQYYENVNITVFDEGVEIATWSTLFGRSETSVLFREIDDIYYGDKSLLLRLNTIANAAAEKRLTISLDNGKNFRFPNVHDYFTVGDIQRLADQWNLRRKRKARR